MVHGLELPCPRVSTEWKAASTVTACRLVRPVGRSSRCKSTMTDCTAGAVDPSAWPRYVAAVRGHCDSLAAGKS